MRIILKLIIFLLVCAGIPVLAGLAIHLYVSTKLDPVPLAQKAGSTAGTLINAYEKAKEKKDKP